MGSSVKVLVGTKKGAFIYTSDEQRQFWEVSAPIMPGWAVYHMAAESRAGKPGRIYAATGHWAWGPSVARSDDGGKTWEQRSPGLSFPQDMGISVQHVWHVQPGHERRPGEVYAGTDPAGLFRSEDWGASWTPIDSINRHEFRPFWQPIPGAALSVMSMWAGQGVEVAERIVRATGKPGGGTLHSIEIDPRDPDHLYVAISAGGSYATRDGGATWELFSHHALPASPQAKMYISQVAASAPPGVDPAAEFDMHKLRLDPKHPDRLWAQAHTGVFRSDDGGHVWQDVTVGLPSFHGFPVAVTRHAPDAAYVVPLQADEFRVCPGQFTVYRTRDAGATWQPLTCGLPGPGDYQSVYREGLDTDGLEPEGVYVGTSNGQVYASPDGGDHWQRLPGTLPPVLSVTCAVY